MAFARRDEFTWRLRTRSLKLGRRTLIMGVLNVTPDSFSDGNLFLAPEEAAAQALRMIDEGADIVDVGGELTRPGKHEPASAEEEQRTRAAGDRSCTAGKAGGVAVDRYLQGAPWRRLAAGAGAEIVNDISGLSWDPEMGATCAELACGVVMMHTRGKSAEWRNLPQLAQHEVVPLVKYELALSMRTALEAGVDRDRIVLDPGYGFGKSFDENYPLLAHQDELESLGQPILAGVSRKSFLGRRLAEFYGGEDAPVTARGNATIAATVAAILAGAHIVRVHEVRPAAEAALIADAILSAV